MLDSPICTPHAARILDHAAALAGRQGRRAPSTEHAVEALFAIPGSAAWWILNRCDAEWPDYVAPEVRSDRDAGAAADADVLSDLIARDRGRPLSSVDLLRGLVDTPCHGRDVIMEAVEIGAHDGIDLEHDEHGAAGRGPEPFLAEVFDEFARSVVDVEDAMVRDDVSFTGDGHSLLPEGQALVERVRSGGSLTAALPHRIRFDLGDSCESAGHDDSECTSGNHLVAQALIRSTDLFLACFTEGDLGFLVATDVHEVEPALARFVELVDSSAIFTIAQTSSFWLDAEHADTETRFELAASVRPRDLQFEDVLLHIAVREHAGRSVRDFPWGRTWFVNATRGLALVVYDFECCDVFAADLAELRTLEMSFESWVCRHDGGGAATGR